MLGGTVERPRGRGHRDGDLVSNLPAVELDEGPDDEQPSYRAPLPPSDRLWRHPSEVGGGEAPVAQTSPSRRGRSRSPWLVAVVAGGAGRVLGRRCPGRLRAARPQGRRTARRRARGRRARCGDHAAPVRRRWPPWSRRCTPSVARIEVGGLIGSASGSGVMFRDDGYLITNAHVVTDATDHQRRLGRRQPARRQPGRVRHRERHRRRADRRHRLQARALRPGGHAAGRSAGDRRSARRSASREARRRPSASSVRSTALCETHGGDAALDRDDPDRRIDRRGLVGRRPVRRQRIADRRSRPQSRSPNREPRDSGSRIPVEDARHVAETARHRRARSCACGSACAARTCRPAPSRTTAPRAAPCSTRSSPAVRPRPRGSRAAT